MWVVSYGMLCIGMMRSVSPSYYLLLWAVYGLFSFIFLYTDGFSGPQAEDNFAIVVGLVLSISAVVWGNWRYELPLTLGDVVVYGLLLVTQALYLATIEYRSIVDAITLGDNVSLLIWVLSYVILCIVSMVGAAKAAVQKFRSG